MIIAVVHIVCIAVFPFLVTEIEEFFKYCIKWVKTTHVWNQPLIMENHWV